MRLAELFTRIVGDDVPVEFSAYDGSRTWKPNAKIRFDVRSPLALSYLAAAPGELGIVRAYVSGSLDIVGDMHDALTVLPKVRIADIPPDVRRQATTKLLAARMWWPVRPPPQERKLRGRLHSKRRDAGAISHHYDVSNRFYELVLGPSMTYTCACFPAEDATLEQAQFAKYDLVARKLGLREGMRVLDVGCGWGGMVAHAAKHYGARVLGVTLSEQQARWGQRAIERQGLSGVAEVRHADYRDVAEGDFDAVSSIGLTEHIGQDQIPGYFRFLYDKLRTGGRLLNHCITRPSGGIRAKMGPFIGRYVFPDGELESPGSLVTQIHDTGFEVRHEENLREHYARTLAGWCANLEANWSEAVREVGAATARVWRLYMAASRVAFERNTLQLHQILAVKLDGTDAHMPLRPDWGP